ncbi:YitT family protein [Liquorilactobacillus satsumensis]|uniref:Integral membrane protein n=1 Tax=Liquorilactobacillus satsumensis DSM 16230 = JCM 12392 TaxID=1423801 RepID=A0A0R1V351_9LACO|nr:YitT family protein [Liquorilactobacillus satsumensis]KRL97173.1 integral membrane protein [Liquorilactobacillus satsumensis DSM 16230 = JCM 12392]MCC7667745.1 YitT family protein [Liquorilactobacillus satsumensis]MCP9311928.1 YitT family protein [Liquorilactobacillus satsumensis]MCP9356924.1 YitT family protein [Liquorilactobacillus satsumensis]MCP9359061.1 YitT family protein [Liquorilactobacillus satsumensis]
MGKAKKKLLKITVAILYGLLSAVGINIFLLPANSYSIGIPGIAQLLHAILKLGAIDLSISDLVILLNIPLFVIAWKLFGREYTTYSLLAVAANVVFLKMVPNVVILKEPLTNSVIGGLIIGIGIGLCFRSDFSTGGTDVIVTYLQKRFKLKIGSINNYINGCILITAALFFGFSGAIYSFISMVVTSLAMDYVYIQQKSTMLLIFTKEPVILEESLRKLGYGATIFKGRGIYSQSETDLIVLMTKNSQLSSLKKMIKLCDPKSFVSIQKADSILGNYYQINRAK